MCTRSQRKDTPNRNPKRKREKIQTADAEEIDKGTDSEAYKVAKLLTELARPKAESFTQNYEKDVSFMMGENHWPSIRSWSSGTSDAWKNRSVRNYMHAVISHKAAVVLGAKPKIRVNPMGSDVDLDTRQHIAAFLEDEMQRLHWDEVREDLFMGGAPCGVAGVMIRLESDKLSGEQKIALDEMNMRRFYPDPDYNRPHKWRFATYEPYWGMSVIKETFPERGHLVKPKPQQQSGRYSVTDNGRERTADEIVYGPGGEAIISKDGSIAQLGADVCLVTIKDNSLAQELIKKVISGPEMLAQCPQCGYLMHADVGTGGQTCDTCGYSGEMPLVERPEQTEEYTEVSRAYPYGRLVAYSGDVLLFDGPNPLPLGPEDIYPYDFYVHRTVKGRWWGYGDVPLGKSIQMAIDKNGAQAIDALRMTFNGPFEYPAEAEGYTNLGNSPGLMVPVALPFMGKAHFIRPDSTNIALFQTVEEILQRDLQRTLEVTDVTVGISPTAPTSGVEVQARINASSTGTTAHLNRLNRCDSSLLNKIWQIAQKTYVAPRTVMMQGPQSDFEAVTLEMTNLPRNVRINVEASLDATQRDENMGQNLVGALSNPAIMDSPYFNQIIELITRDPIMSDEIKMVKAQTPPPPPQVDPTKVLSAVADGAKSGLPVALNQWEAALIGAGLPPPQGPNVTPELPKPESKAGETK